MIKYAERLTEEDRTALTKVIGQAQRYDDEYERIGTANNLMIGGPLAGWRKVSVRTTKTARDLAQEIKELLDVDFRKAEKLVLVWDSLDTHAPHRRRCAKPLRCRRRVDSWSAWRSTTAPNTAAGSTSPRSSSAFSPGSVSIGTSSTSISCAARPRLGVDRSNASGAVVDWQFTTDNARIKLNRLCPQLKEE
jgi:hypothetical protein